MIRALSIGAIPSEARTERWNWLIPSFPECLFLALMIWFSAKGTMWSVLLADGDTGWHIRTGQYILSNGSVPRQDLFSFSKPGQPWFAWEWLADVVFAALHSAWGLKGVVLLCGIVLALAAALLFEFLMRAGANVLIALLVTLLTIGVSTIHYLARPHVFTFLFLTISLFVLDRDRRRADGMLWLLVPLAALWANLHGGFLALLVCLSATAAGFGARAWLHKESARPFIRYAGATAACAAATLLNPYGWRLHQHIAAYLQSDWIRDVVEEFQSPKFRSESMLQFEVLLLLGLALVARLLVSRKYEEALLIIFWAHAALGSVRHVPIFGLVAAPALARELTILWETWTRGADRRSAFGVLRDVGDAFSRLPRSVSVWAPLAVAFLFCLAPREYWPADFPEQKFPVRAIEKNAGRLIHSGARVLTTDQWADYLIYRFYPDFKVFVDGRSDFYGRDLGKQYLDLMNAQPGWQRVLSDHHFNLALVPAGWPLTQLLRQQSAWKVLYDDGKTALFERVQKPDAS